MTDLPPAVDRLVAELSRCRGVQAVALGGSRALGRHRDDSDWDLGVYYRGQIDLGPLAGYGGVHPPGTWGRLMNGGGWFDMDGRRVDVLLRDLDAVEWWMSEAIEGRFQIDGLPGYVAGIPTYSVVAELDANVPLIGELPTAPQYPDALADHGAFVWRLNRDFSLKYAAMHVANGQWVAAIGQLCRATLEEAHARSCVDARWVLNEKRLVDDAGMNDVQRRISELVAALDVRTVDAVRQLLSAED